MHFVSPVHFRAPCNSQCSRGSLVRRRVTQNIAPLSSVGSIDDQAEQQQATDRAEAVRVSSKHLWPHFLRARWRPSLQHPPPLYALHEHTYSVSDQAEQQTEQKGEEEPPLIAFPLGRVGHGGACGRSTRHPLTLTHRIRQRPNRATHRAAG